MVYSRLAGREVSTWSEEWKHECEIAYLAGMKPEKLKGMLYGVQGAQDESARGIKSHRGDAAVAKLVSEIERYRRAAMKASQIDPLAIVTGARRALRAFNTIETRLNWRLNADCP